MGELDVGRGQIQLLSSLFHADGPNDVAPGRLQRRHAGRRPPVEPAVRRPRADRLPQGVLTAAADYVIAGATMGKCSRKRALPASTSRMRSIQPRIIGTPVQQNARYQRPRRRLPR